MPGQESLKSGAAGAPAFMGRKAARGGKPAEAGLFALLLGKARAALGPAEPGLAEGEGAGKVPGTGDKSKLHKHLTLASSTAKKAPFSELRGAEPVKKPKAAELSGRNAGRGVSTKPPSASEALDRGRESGATKAGKGEPSLATRKGRGGQELPAQGEPNLAAAQLAVLQATAQRLAPSPAARPNESPTLEAAEKANRTASSAPRLELSDLRRARQKKAASSELAESPAKASPVEEKGGVKELKLELGRLDSKPQGEAPSPGATEKPAAGGTDFSSLLSDKLREAWNGEIVKSAHIILRDGDMGTIRLRLRPESLGSVKIELNLAENNISGKIVVESDEAKSAFERSMAELQDAFREGGFDSAKLEVALGSGGGDPRGGSGSGAEGSEGPYWSERRRGAAFEEAVPRALPGSPRAERALDILA